MDTIKLTDELVEISKLSGKYPQAIGILTQAL